ncbi:O-methyltransferase [Crocinitomicaceae bacterium]|jgi:caffeoyl-CoA O-methyltransferase|nr:O-methyltransferase [Crocinitomicaceae bacterium]
MNFIEERVEEYAMLHTTKESELLNKIDRETHLEVLRPRMLSGHFQGRILSMLSKMISPNRILEIGTYTGYSALCLAEGLMEDGKLYTIDINEELEDRVRQYFLESNYNQQIDFVIGDALHLIPRLNESWDIVFIDADKKNYTKYFNMVVASVKSGGYIIADNVLWSGKVVEKDHVDEDTLALRVFNDTLSKDPRFEVILLPVRDGLLIARKK